MYRVCSNISDKLKNHIFGTERKCVRKIRTPRRRKRTMLNLTKYNKLKSVAINVSGEYSFVRILEESERKCHGDALIDHVIEESDGF